jgi:hypothetical protein
MMMKAFAWRWRKLLLAVAGVFCALVIANFLFPPDMTRVQLRSTEVLDRHGELLRPFLSRDGYWRLKTTAADVDPRYLILLKAYEDKRFDSHPGVDPLALARAAWQWAVRGHVVSGASTLTMQVARLLEPGRPRTVPTKFIQMVRAVQLELRYSKDDILSFYLTLAPFGGNLEGGARCLARLFRQGAAFAFTLPIRIAGGLAAVAGASAPRSPSQSGKGGARSCAGAHGGRWRGRKNGCRCRAARCTACGPPCHAVCRAASGAIPGRETSGRTHPHHPRWGNAARGRTACGARTSLYG